MGGHRVTLPLPGGGDQPVDRVAEELVDHSELGALFRLWDDARGGRPMPSRRDFTPESLRPWLGNLALIDVVYNPLRLHYRLVGVHIVTNLKCDPTGKDFADVVSDPADNPATRGPYRCLLQGQPAFEIVRPRRRASFCFDFARLSLPLSADGQAINMILTGEYVVAPSAQREPDQADTVNVPKLWN